MRPSLVASGVSAGLSIASVLVEPTPTQPRACGERALASAAGREYVAVRVPWRAHLSARALEPATAVGMIESVAASRDTFVLRPEDDAAMTVTVSDATAYTLNGAEAGRDEALVVARKATVTHENGVATRVDVVSED